MEGSATEAPGAEPPARGMLGRPFIDMLLVDGALLLLASLIAFSWGNLGGILLYLPIAIPGLIGPVLVLWKGRPWTYLLSAIGLLLFPLLLLSYTPASALDPPRGPEFIGSLLMVLSAALGVPAGIAGFRGAKKDAPKATMRDGLRTKWGLAAVLVTGILFGAMLAGAGAWVSATSASNASTDLTPEATVTLAAENYLFTPSNITVPQGRVVEIVVVNKDAAYHTFTYTVAGKTYSHALLGLSTARFVVFFAAAGDIRFWCIPHEGMGMVGNIHVA